MVKFQTPPNSVQLDSAINPQQAKKFASQAKSLEQIANFHNTIGDRMITSQRPMMLDAAVGLAKLVKDQTNMTWDNTQQVSGMSKNSVHTVATFILIKS